MKRYSVVITPLAGKNIDEAYAWLTARNPGFAERWLAEIRDKILGIETLPASHPVALESDAFDEDIRHLLVGRGDVWRVFFAIKGSAVHVLHVRHGSRDAWRP